VNAVDDHEWTALHWAAENGRVDVVKVLIQNGADLNAVDINKCTALHRAAEDGHVDVVKLLLQNGADVNAFEEYYLTALHITAKESGNVDVAKVLIQNGANVNAVDRDHKTALHWAAKNGHVDVAQVLIQHGADAKALCKGLTPLVLSSREYGDNNHRKPRQRIILDLIFLLLFRCGVRSVVTFSYPSIPLECYRTQVRVTDKLIQEQGWFVRLKSIQKNYKKVFTREERKFLYNFGFVLARKYPGVGGKIFHTVLGFMSYDGIFLSHRFRIGYSFPHGYCPKCLLVEAGD
jgi:hypothetical protein